MQGDQKNKANKYEGLKKPSHLEDLEKSLYRRDRTAPRIDREKLVVHPRTAVGNEWKHEPVDGMSHEEVNTVRSSFFTTLFVASFAFFALAAGFGAYMIFGGSGGVSSKNLDISVVGPVAIPAGTPLELQVVVRNNNSTPLENAQLVVEYPDGTKSVQNNEKDLTYEKDSLGTIASGEMASHTLKALLFGPAESLQHIKITVQYNVSGSNTLFYVDSGYDVTISSSPISLTVKSFEQITSGQQVDLEVEVVSNSTSVVRGILLHAIYPFGFVAGNSAPLPAYGDSTWNIGDMKPGDKRTIHILGTLSAQDGEARIFKFQVGTASANNPKVIGTSFISLDRSITVEKPFLGVAVSLDNVDAKVYATAPLSTVHSDITWSNNTSSDIDNAEIVVKLKGDLFDKSGIVALGGYYRSADNTITWNSTTNPELARLAPGASGRVGFDFKTLPVTSVTGSIKQPQVSFDVSVSGRRLGNPSPQETVSSGESRTIKISSTPALASRLTYSTGPFQNNGPIPPKADRSVTYTVIWTLTNTANPISGAKVKAVLPSYVNWLGASIPAGEKISFDPVTRQMEWNPGTIASDVGIKSPAREVAFQVSFLPSVSQIGSAPIILKQTSFVGTDTWTNVTLEDMRGELSSELTSDPDYIPGNGQVQN